MLLLGLPKSVMPDNPDFLYNLGMTDSDIGELERSITILPRLLKLIALNLNGRVAMGVARHFRNA